MSQGTVALLISLFFAIGLCIMLKRYDKWGNYDGYKKSKKVKKRNKKEE